jgi:hypothetical protein
VRKRKGGRGVPSKYVTIGNHGVFTPEQAREHAVAALPVIALGGDPTAERRAEKNAPTVRVFAEQRFLPEHVDTKCKPRTRAEYRWVLDHVILPAIDNKRLSDVTHADATRLHHARRQTPYLANVAIAIAIARKMFNLAERWGERPLNSNPFRGIAARDRCLGQPWRQGVHRVAQFGRSASRNSIMGQHSTHLGCGDRTADRRPKRP